MIDDRIRILADILLGYSCEVQPNEKVLIEAFDIPDDIVATFVKMTAERGAIPVVSIKQSKVLRELYRAGTEEGLKFIGQVEAERMKGVQAYIGIRGNHNIAEMSDVPSEKMELYGKHIWNPVHNEIRVPKTKWCVIRWPHPSMAQAANQPTDRFEDFFFKVCCLDYAKMDRAMDPLKELMDKSDRVRITGPDTDLTFSIKGIGSVKCSGKRNIPDGEVFSCPVKESVNGRLYYTADTLYHGTLFSGVRFEFKNGKIVNASASNMKKLNEILDTDPGARYIGEFSLGINPYITYPIKDILFDEKIAGSFHFTPGQAYTETDNGNRSQVHWDIVCIQTPEYGGGEIYFDDILIRKDGRFVLPQLQDLNPENLV
jgi:aminopeptidase